MTYAAFAPRTLCKPTVEHFCVAPDEMSQPQTDHTTLITSLLATHIDTL